MKRKIITAGFLLAAVGLVSVLAYENATLPSKITAATPTEALAAFVREPYTTTQQASDLLMIHEKLSFRLGLKKQNVQDSGYEVELPALEAVKYALVLPEPSGVKTILNLDTSKNCISLEDLMSKFSFMKFEQSIAPHIGVGLTAWNGRLQLPNNQRREVLAVFEGYTRKCLFALHVKHHNNH